MAVETLNREHIVGDTSLGLYIALQSVGIIELSFDPNKQVNESLMVTGINTDAGFMTGWLASFGDNIYSISRTGHPGSASESGNLFAFQKVPVTASTSSSTGTGLKLINQASSNGKGGVHCQVSPDGKILAAANITASTISIHQLSETGAIGKTAHILDYNQIDPGPKAAHPHQVAFDPTGQFLVVPLRTMDRIDIFSLNEEYRLKRVHRISVPESTGPRHVEFNPISLSKAYMYLISEKDNSIHVFTWEYKSTASQGLDINFRQTLSTMGKDLGRTPAEHKHLAAEIAVSNDGNFVYASNRDLSHTNIDTIAIYSVDSDPSNEENHLTYLGCQDTNGKFPRMFALSNDRENKWVAVANQWSQDIVIFERDTVTGFLKDPRGKLSIKVAVPHQTTADKVTFVKYTSTEPDISRDELLKGRSEGPMCVMWK